MGLKKKLYNKIVFIDSAPIIYFIEGHSVYQKELLEIFKENDNGNIHFISSSLTLMEVIVLPLRHKRYDLVEKYEQILIHSPNIYISDIGIQITKRAATIRAIYNFKTPDALQLATAIENKADFFLTNDKSLTQVKEIEVITL